MNIAKKFDSSDDIIQHTSLLINGVKIDRMKIPGAYKSTLVNTLIKHISNYNINNNC